MSNERLFMGGVAMALGATALVAAAGRSDTPFRLPKVRWIDERWGRGVARVVFGVAGLALVALGVAILLSSDRPD